MIDDAINAIAGDLFGVGDGEPIYQTALPPPELNRNVVWETSSLRKQEGGDHYKKMVIQPWQYIAANKLNYWEGNVVKYVTRHQSKAGLEDLKKARHYLDYLIENYKDVY